MVIMKKGYILTFLLSFAFGIGLVLLAATSSMAVHKGAGDLVCGACHTMHSSQGSTTASGSTPSMGGNQGSSILLRTSVTGSTAAEIRANLHNFCLQCHSAQGAQNTTQNNSGVWLTTPPKVQFNPGTQWDGSSFQNVGSGGLFSGTYSNGSYSPPTTDNAANDALGIQHSIGRTTVVPPGNSAPSAGTSAGVAITALSCTSCHDPHGTNVTTATINKYRNLKAGSAITASGTNGVQNPWSDMANFEDLATSYVGGVGGSAAGGVQASAPGASGIASFDNIWPVWRTGNSQNSYRVVDTPVTLGGTPVTMPSGVNTAGNVGFSAFCAQCHGAWHEGINSNMNIIGDDWKRHPVNNVLAMAGSELSGAGVTIIDWTHYNNREGAATGQGQAPYTAVDATRLPAADNAGNARYYADSNQDKVFCLTCHFSHGSIYNDLLRWNYTSFVNTGEQTGNAIASNVGCQQCHNR